MLLNHNEDVDIALINQQKKRRSEHEQSQLERLADERENDGVGPQPYRYTLGDTFLCGTLDPDEVTLEVEDIRGDRSCRSIVHMFRHVINNLEINHPEIDIVIWEIDKNRGIEVIQHTLKAGFEVYETRPYTLVLAYHLNNNSPSSASFGSRAQRMSDGAQR